MLDQIDTFLRKLLAHGLVSNPAEAQLYALDDEIYSNRDTIPGEVISLFDALNISSLIIARPEPLRWAIISELLRSQTDIISPSDSESITFIHDIPVERSFQAGRVAGALSRRKGCIVEGLGIITTGAVSLEQAFIAFSSICFATFVKYFADVLNGLTGHAPRPSAEEIAACRGYLSSISLKAEGINLSPQIPKGEMGIISNRWLWGATHFGVEPDEKWYAAGYQGAWVFCYDLEKNVGRNLGSPLPRNSLSCFTVDTRRGRLVGTVRS